MESEGPPMPLMQPISPMPPMPPVPLSKKEPSRKHTLKLIKQDNIRQNKEYIVKEINTDFENIINKLNNDSLEFNHGDYMNNFTINDLYYYMNDTDEEGNIIENGEYKFYHLNILNIFISNTNNNNDTNVIEINNDIDVIEKKLEYIGDGKWHYDDKEYYIFECPCQPNKENLKPIEPNSIKQENIKNGTTYFLSSCVNLLTVKLKEIKEININDGGDEDKINLYKFEVINDKYEKQHDYDLCLFARINDDETLVWESYNIYTIFVPGSGEIIEQKLGEEIEQKLGEERKICFNKDVSSVIYSFIRNSKSKSSNKGGKKNKSKKNSKSKSSKKGGKKSKKNSKSKGKKSRKNKK